MLLALSAAQHRLAATAGRLRNLSGRPGCARLRLLCLPRALHRFQQRLRLGWRGCARAACCLLCHLRPNHRQHGGRGSQRPLQHVHPDLQRRGRGV